MAQLMVAPLPELRAIFSVANPFLHAIFSIANPSFVGSIAINLHTVTTGNTNKF